MKHLTCFCLFLMLFLTACGGAALPDDSNTSGDGEAIASVTAPTESSTEEPEESTENYSDTESPTNDESADSTPTPVESDQMSLVGTLTPPAGEATAEVASNGPAECYTDPITELIDLAKMPGLPEVSDEEWQQGGGADAEVTIIEYGDFQ